MDSTLKSRDSDPHDIFVIAPEVVPAAWADKVLADITNDAGGDAGKAVTAGITSQSQPNPAAIAAAPAVDTTFRAAVTDETPVPDEQPSTNRWVKKAFMLMLALCSAAAAAAWQNHSDAAKQMVSGWMPAFTLAASPSTENNEVPAPADTAAASAVSEQTSATSAAPAQPLDNAVSIAAAASSDAAQLQVMARDLAAMAQQIEQLKASIAELKAIPPSAAREATKTSEVKPVEQKPAAQTPRPRASPPPRSAAASPQRPLPAYPPTQVAAPAPLPQSSTLPAPPPQAATRTEDGEPVVRPPMPLRWGQDFR